MTQLFYTIFITNNHNQFHLWLVKTKASKHYDHDCLENFLLCSLSLLTTTNVKISHNLTKHFLIFVKQSVRANLKVKFWTQRKVKKNVVNKYNKFQRFFVIQLQYLFINVELKALKAHWQISNKWYFENGFI